MFMIHEHINKLNLMIFISMNKFKQFFTNLGDFIVEHLSFGTAILIVLVASGFVYGIMSIFPEAISTPILITMFVIFFTFVCYKVLIKNQK